MGRLRRKGILVDIDRQALIDDAIEIDKVQLESSLTDLSLGRTLRRMLADVGLIWMPKGGLLVISTPVAEGTIHRLYPVGDILPWEKYPVYAGFGGSTTYEYGFDFDSWIEAITTQVSPDTWEEVGGACTIEPLTLRGRPVLSISATQEVHEGVFGFLQHARTALRTTPSTARALTARRQRAGASSRLRSSSASQDQLESDFAL